MTVGPDWDDFRAEYPTLSLLDQRAFYEQVVQAFPDQHSYLGEEVLAFLQAAHPWTVVEVGGWDGRLAREMLTLTPIAKWTNYEIAPVPAVCDDLRYRHVLIDEWPWEMDSLQGDALVLSHVVEHMLLGQFAALVERFTGDAVYIDCPVTEGPQDWTGYPGTHVIEKGWDGIEERLAGWERVTEPGPQRWYTRQA